MNNERQQQILEMLEQKGEVQLQQLKDFFPEVSVMTLRRDLISLENEGYLIRTHGGAVSAKKVAAITGEEDEYSRRAAEHIEAKLKIAEKAVPLVERGRSIYFDAGSTIMCLAKLIPDESFSIVTSGANIALELLKKQNCTVITLGGHVNPNTLSVSGPNAVSYLDSINIDIAFMSASGLSPESGLTVSNVYECEVKKKVVRRAKKVVILLDSRKINKNMTFTYANLEDIDVLVCERPLPADIKAEAEKYGVRILD
ncbi:DeoR/GlpR family DNA-binding transcription regulator [Petroclostridium sp. X23]|uniref:DeoR/GlpR family DNA-binding transcription regulator n=1 Tax=Petroclostridium sp. X23 TaxID=3045146 RepID=UPI0024ADCA0B|nr:DeoR/GlpR family DNA-binding transcription regulator [Petroclostridium sp. X23]WHH61533.1 DeoR/GlpR family DNA-binding transcription regulator [Petroclostridium sp. X23]